PHISPKKTVEGAIVGVIGGIVPATLVLVAADKFTTSAMIPLALGPLLAILGDLVESGLKRLFQVKDSHLTGFDILPGHGGVLDRVDGLILVTVFAYAYLVSTGLAACGLGLLAGALRRAGVADGPAAPAAPGEPAPLADWRSVAITVAALLAQILLLERAGFIISSTILFAGVAWAFGSRRHGRDVVIGFILAFVVYWSFTQWLGLRLPAGILRPVLVWLGGS
ncbi:MAG: phosphatidate cytidylyltransferase, partial [Limnochordales bacterium]